MQTISINSIGAVHGVAAAISGFGDVELDLDGQTSRIRSGFPQVDLRFADCASVTIEAPRTGYQARRVDAQVTWSSSSSSSPLRAAVRTSRVLAFAAQVADQLNQWVADGQIVITDSGVEVAS